MAQKNSFWLNYWTYLASVCCAALLIIVCSALPAKADVIYHAFDQKFQEIKAELPELKNIGYTYVQVSPPQKSNPAETWWGRYQPLDYVICSDKLDKDCPLGNENDLKELIDAAHKNDQKIIVDVVFNHMANYPPNVDTLNYPPLFSSEDFHNRTCISNDNDRFQVTHGWLGRDCDLPDLKTETPHVREEAKKYLKHLVSLGADGFRFDAAKHIDRDFFLEVLQAAPGKYYYGEVLGSNMNDYNQYTDIMDVTDDKLIYTIRNAIKWGGDLRSLVNPQDTGRALPGDKAVTFAVTHDTVNNDKSEDDYDRKDQLLANAYVLAIREGFPLIYRDDAKEEITKAGVKFHEKMMGQPQYFRNGNEIAPGADNGNMLFIERGGKGLTIINKSGEFFEVKAAKMPGLETGCYKDLHYNFPMSVHYGKDGNKYINKWGSPDRGGIKIGPRDVLFFIQTYADDCKAIWN